MNKSKATFIVVFVALLLLLTGLKAKHRYDYEQKLALAHETKKVLSCLMVDLSQAHSNGFTGIPADGLWHEHLAFTGAHGPLEYNIKDGHLFRVGEGQSVLIADHIHKLSIRRQSDNPGVLEIQLRARNSVELVSNLKMRTLE